MKLKLLTAILVLSLSSVKGQEYKHASQFNKINGDQAYILPKAAFSIEVSIVKNSLIPGDSIKTDYKPPQLALLKRKYGLDIDKYNKAISKNVTTTYSIAEDSIKVNIKSIPDYTKIYFVNPKAKWNKNQTVSFTYGTDGILTEGESSMENKTFDIVVKGLSGLSAIVGAALKNAKSHSDDYQVPTNIKSLDEALVKFNTLENQINYDIYKDLKNKYERDYNAIFADIFYKEKKEITVVKFIYSPSSQTAVTTAIPLFKLDETKGTLVFNNATQNQIIIKEAIFDSNIGPCYSIFFEKLTEQQSDYNTARTDSCTGFAYNIPLSVYTKLINPKSKILYYEAGKLPQLGITGFTNTRKEKLTFQLDPLTGELKKLTIEGKAISTDQVGSISPLVTEIVTTAKGDSNAVKLENEVKQLENEIKKRELLKKLESQ